MVPWGVLSAAEPVCDSPVGILLFLAPGVVASHPSTTNQSGMAATFGALVPQPPP